MQENKKLELSILQCLINEDRYNAGMAESEFLMAFHKSSYYHGEDDMFINSVIVAHCKLMKLRNYIEYGASSNGTRVGPVLPDGYDFIEKFDCV